MTTNFANKTSSKVQFQLPEFIRSDTNYETFVAFIQAYYEWLEQQNIGSGKEGGYTTLIGAWEKQVEEHQPLTIYGDGTKRRDFTHVNDIVDGLIKIEEKPDAIMIITDPRYFEWLFAIENEVRKQVPICYLLVDQSHHKLQIMLLMFLVIDF